MSVSKSPVVDESVLTPEANSLPVVPHFIGGRPVEGRSGRFGDVYNPATGTLARRVAFAGKAEVDEAVAAATAAFPQWAAAPPLRRARILNRFRELLERDITRLAAIITAEHGKVASDAAGEMQRGIEVVEFATGHPAAAERRIHGRGRDGRRQLLDPTAARRRCGYHAVQFSGDGADVDVSGCSGVRQHLYSEAEREGPFDEPGVGSVAQRSRLAGRRVQRGQRRQRGCGRAHRASVASRRSVSSARRRLPSTSTRTALRTGKRVQALGGAKNHMVVMPDADLDQADDALVGAAYGSAGERCMAISVAVAVGDAAGRRTRLPCQASSREPQGRARR